MSRRVPSLPSGGALVVLVGGPASGKSTFASQYPSSWRVCLDAYRELAADDEADQSATPVAVQVQELLVDARLSRGLPCVVDSTNVRRPDRARLLARARYWRRPAIAVLFTVPLQVAERRNAARARTVPTHILRDLHARVPTAVDLRRDGFDAVHVYPTGQEVSS